MKVSIVSLGGMGVISRHHKSQEAAATVVHAALDRGLNFIETARGYHDSEAIIGGVVENRRDGVYLATKSYLRSAKRCEQQIQESLQNLRTAKIDLYQVHHVQYADELEQVLGKGGALEAIRSYQKQGLIDHVGITSHHPSILTQALETGQFDVVQFPFSVVERDHYLQIHPVAKKHDVGIIAMKSLSGGHLQDPSTAIKYVLSHDIATAAMGCSTVEHVQVAAEAAESFRTLTEEEKRALIEEADRLPEKFCRRCRYCEPGCPAGIPIADVFRIENYLILNATYARNDYRALKANASRCLECGECERICPYHLPIREDLKRAHSRLTRGKLEDLAVNALRKVRLYDVARKLYFDLGGDLPER
jgi:uncharacterized protein